MSRVEITAYVDWDGDLRTIDTNERLRRATSDERSESRAEHSGTGAIKTSVSERTLRRRAPRFVRTLVYLGAL